MTTPLIRRPFEETDAAALASWLSSDPHELFLTSSSLKFPLTVDQFLSYWRKNAAPDSHEFFTFLDANTNEQVGHCEMKGMSLVHRHGTIANVFINPSARGRRLGTRMIELMLDGAFQQKRLHRVGLAVHSHNAAALMTYVRAGFQFEGVIRDVLRFEDRYYSLCQMSILESEYAARRR